MPARRTRVRSNSAARKNALRRAQTRARVQAPSRGPEESARRPTRARRRSPWRLAGVLVAALVVAGAAAFGLESLVGGAGSALPLPPPQRSPVAYSVVYRVTSPGSPTQMEVEDLDRPFLGRELSESSDGTLQEGTLTTAHGSYVYLRQPSPGWVYLAAGTSRAAGEQNALDGLRAGAAHGLAKVVGTRRLLGRSCTVFETGTTIGSPLQAPTGTDHADVCVTSAGVILQEDWTVSGKLARRRVAVAYDPSPAFSPSTWDPTPSAPPSEAAALGSTTSVTVLAADQSATLPVRLTPPPGFGLDGIQAQTSQTGAGSNTVTVAHYTDGPQLLDLYEGQIAAASGGYRVPLGPGRSGRMVLDMTASQLFVTLGGKTVELEGGDPGLLTAAARGLFVPSG